MSELKAGSRNIMSLTRWGKFWITITIVSLLLYDLRWIYGVINRFQSIFASPDLYATVEPWRFWVDYVVTGIICDSGFHDSNSHFCSSVDNLGQKGVALRRTSHEGSAEMGMRSCNYISN